ncbi:MAG: DUF6531 domain-containing protein, partial [Gallionellaceae bacterium]|nr:DUF6531 domain-containing protein [Gallionellaceae bacterium]
MIPQCPSSSTPLNDTTCTCNSSLVANRDQTACTTTTATGYSGKNTGGSCSLSQGNPINVGTGLKYQVEVDCRAPSGLEFKRTYNSQAAYETPAQSFFGQNSWRLGWNRTIQGTPAPPPSYPLPANSTVYRLGLQPNWIPDNTAITAYVTRDDGKTYTYTRSGDTWQSDADVTGQLTSQFDAAGKLTGWTYTTDDHKIETYNASGQLTSTTNRIGQTTTLNYSDGSAVTPNGGYVLDAAGVPTTAALSAGLLIRVTDAYARSLSLGYDSLSRIVKMTDPAGGVYGYTYDANSNLSLVTYPDLTTKTYLYENPTYPHALTGILDENA